MGGGQEGGLQTGGVVTTGGDETVLFCAVTAFKLLVSQKLQPNPHPPPNHPRSHVPFTHHKSISNRNVLGDYNTTLTQPLSAAGFEGVWKTGPRCVLGGSCGWSVVWGGRGGIWLVHTYTNIHHPSTRHPSARHPSARQGGRPGPAVRSVPRPRLHAAEDRHGGKEGGRVDRRRVSLTGFVGCRFDWLWGGGGR